MDEFLCHSSSRMVRWSLSRRRDRRPAPLRADLRAGDHCGDVDKMRTRRAVWARIRSAPVQRHKEMSMSKHHRLTVVFIFVLVALSSGEVGAQGQPEGQLTIAFDASIAPTFLDPAETSGIATPFV